MRDPEILYHYTDANGLMGILQGKTLWATSILHLNDSQEFAYFRDEAIASLKKAYVGHVGEEEIGKMCSVFEGMGVSKFVFCLSELGDRLSQWRGYCPNGNGFSIGFDREKLASVLKVNAKNITQCQYGAHGEEASAIINKLVEQHAKRTDSFIGKGDEGFRATEALGAITDFMVGTANHAHRFKHPGFEEEREWRVAVSPNPYRFSDIKYRSSTLGLVPYVELNMSDTLASLVPEVLVGPTADSNLAKKTVEDFLRKNGWTETEVKLSETPYRT